MVGNACCGYAEVTPSRTALRQQHPAPFTGPVEVDETYIGGKEKNKHKSKRLRAGRGADDQRGQLVELVGHRRRILDGTDDLHDQLVGAVLNPLAGDLTGDLRVID